VIAVKINPERGNIIVVSETFAEVGLQHDFARAIELNRDNQITSSNVFQTPRRIGRKFGRSKAQ
jgi:hypothetical protein